jgi:hypothetical protein
MYDFLPHNVTLIFDDIPAGCEYELRKLMCAAFYALEEYPVQPIEIIAHRGPLTFHDKTLTGSFDDEDNVISLYIPPFVSDAHRGVHKNLGEEIYRTFAHEYKHFLDNCAGKAYDGEKPYSRRNAEKRAKAYAAKAPMTKKLEAICAAFHPFDLDVPRVCLTETVRVGKLGKLSVRATNLEAKIAARWNDPVEDVAKALYLDPGYVEDTKTLMLRRAIEEETDGQQTIRGLCQSAGPAY